MAWLIDTAVMFGLVLGIGLVLMIAFAIAGYDITSSEQDVQKMIYIIYGIVFGFYPALMEARSGATLGKRAMGLRVVSLDGGPIRLRAALARGAFRLIDGFFFIIPAVFFIESSPLKQRLGDRVASTIVIRSRPVLTSQAGSTLP